jgi:N-acetyl-anhydromuramyl-L-alanine amidase AmpD
MNITPQILIVNHARGRRSGFAVDLIVIHVTEGDAASVVSWFSNPTADVSAHYMIRKDGVIVQFVDEEDTAWHAGRVVNPTAKLVIERHGWNPNGYSIGIEHEGDGHHELTEEQRASSVALIRDICARRSIPIDRRHIVGHHEIFSPKTCPGVIDVDALVRSAAVPPANAS